MANLSDKDSETAGGLEPDRLMAFSDGVLAIAITILVLGIDIPEDNSFSDQGLFALNFKPKIFSTSYSLCPVKFE